MNVAATLRFHGVEARDSAPFVGAATIIFGGSLAAAALLHGKGNPPYALVVLWGLTAIYSSGGQASRLIAVAAVSAGVMVIAGAVTGLRRFEAGRWLG